MLHQFSCTKLHTMLHWHTSVKSSESVVQLFVTMNLLFLAIAFFLEGNAQSHRTFEQPIMLIHINFIITLSMYKSNALFLRAKSSNLLRGVKAMCSYITCKLKVVEFLENASAHRTCKFEYTERTQSIHSKLHTSH